MLKSGNMDLSLHLRIPADKCYLDNAAQTLEGICDHFSVRESDRERMKSVLRMSLDKIIDASHVSNTGLFDLKFSVIKDKLLITVEDFMIDENRPADKLPQLLSEEQVRETLGNVVPMVDEFKVLRGNGRHASYSMLFNLVMAE
ncbi:MAG: hypothetical protein Kow0029_21050 [Candidatus Rifleibacteriota bacterium]